MSRIDNLHTERNRLNNLLNQTRRKIADLEDDPTPGQQKAIRQYQQEIENYQGGINSIDEDIADISRRRVSSYDDRPDPRDRTVIDRYGGPQKIDHRSRY